MSATKLNYRICFTGLSQTRYIVCKFYEYLSLQTIYRLCKTSSQQICNRVCVLLPYRVVTAYNGFATNLTRFCDCSRLPFLFKAILSQKFGKDSVCHMWMETTSVLFSFFDLIFEINKIRSTKNLTKRPLSMTPFVSHWFNIDNAD
jgi:hypothetical protein